MKQFLIIQLILYFGWLSCIAVAQLEVSGAITGSASFPDVGIICLGNLAVFITSFIRKRLDLEMAARDFLATITGPCKFKEIPEGEQKEKVSCIRKLANFIPNFLRRLPDIEMGAGGLVTTITSACRFKENNKNELIAVIQRHPPEASVVMLSNSAGMTNSSIRQFMQYIYNAHDVHSALLKYDILKHAKPDSQCKSKSGSEGHICNCIVISKVEGINMPQVPKELPESPVLLPSLQCLKNGCHGCNPHLLHVEEKWDNLNVEFSSAVCDALDFEFTTPTQKEPICICIPVHPASDDKWTKLLVRILKYKDQGDKGAIVAAADAVQSYLDKRREDRAEKRAEDREDRAEGRLAEGREVRAEGREVRAEDRAEGRLAEDRAEGRAEDRDEGRAEEIKYRTVSLIVIRLVEIFVNLLLTVIFKVDGFSSALAARRAVRSCVVDSKGNGLPANVFLTSGLVVVKSDSVCQVLKFRGNRFFLLIVGCVNLLCAIAWAVVLIAFNGGIGKWYAVPSMAPSNSRVAFIIAAICIGIVMDCFEFRKLVMECIKIFRNCRDSEKSSRDISNEVSNGTNSKTSSTDISNEVSNGTDSQNAWDQIWKKIREDKRNTLMILGVIIFQIGFAVAFGLNKGIGRWVYGALQLLVWVKWLFGSFILGAYSPENVSTPAKRKAHKDGRAFLDYSSAHWVDEGSLVYSSSFFLNAVMVGVMGDWAGFWRTWK